MGHGYCSRISTGLLAWRTKVSDTSLCNLKTSSYVCLKVMGYKEKQGASLCRYSFIDGLCGDFCLKFTPQEFLYWRLSLCWPWC